MSDRMRPSRAEGDGAVLDAGTGASTSDRIRLSRDDLHNPKVDDIVAEQEARQKAMPGFEATPLWRRIVFSSLFFLAVAGVLGGIAGWMILEPFLNETIVFWGTITSVDLPTMGRSQGRMIAVRGCQILVNDEVTRVRGVGEYEGSEGTRDLKVGQPVRVQAMIIDGGNRVLLGERIVVQEIPPEHQDKPLPDLQSEALAMMVFGFLAFAIVGACIAGLIAAADGFMSRNLRRGLLCSLCGIGIAIGGGVVAGLPANMVYGLGVMLAQQSSGEELMTSETVTGASLLILVVGRSLAWGLVGLTVGLGQGAALRSKKLFINGLLGGMLGGLLGGLFFDPIIKIFADTEASGQAIISRAFGFAIIGLSAGLMIGLVEHLAKSAWLLMRAGPLAGKQFVIYKSPTTLGSSPKCEVYLFKDPEVEPRHALVRKVGNRHEVQDLDTPAGTYLNGKKVRRQTLQDGDQIMIGQTVLVYAERSRGGE